MSREKEVFDVPKDLTEHPFYGLELDKDQEKFRDAAWDESVRILFCNAKSGTGKSTLAVGVANLMYKYGKYKKIIYIAAPTQEQKQGYLKGSIEEKSEPYFEPMYNAMDKLGISMSCVLSENNMMAKKEATAYIECVTHTFLRGINFEESVVIIDEAQNFYADELKKVLTRIHDSCKVIVIGHTGQIDLYNHPDRSGFSSYIEYFENTGDSRVAICELNKNYRGWISNTADEYEGEYD